MFYNKQIQITSNSTSIVVRFNRYAFSILSLHANVLSAIKNNNKHNNFWGLTSLITNKYKHIYLQYIHMYICM